MKHRIVRLVTEDLPDEGRVLNVERLARRVVREKRRKNTREKNLVTIASLEPGSLVTFRSGGQDVIGTLVSRKIRKGKVFFDVMSPDGSIMTGLSLTRDKIMPLSTDGHSTCT